MNQRVYTFVSIGLIVRTARNHSASEQKSTQLLTCGSALMTCDVLTTFAWLEPGAYRPTINGLLGLFPNLSYRQVIPFPATRQWL